MRGSSIWGWLAVVVCLLVLASNLQGQVLTGTVQDSITKSPVSFVSVRLKVEKKGTFTDSLGRFSLELSRLPDTLIVTNLGYRPKQIPLSNLPDSGYVVALLPVSYTAKEVLITPESDKNPAHRLIKAAIANRKINDPDRQKAYSYESYAKMEIAVLDLEPDPEKARTLKPLKFIFSYIDTTGGRPMLPIFFAETISEVFYRRFPRLQREFIKASQVTGVQDPNVSQQFSNMNMHTNFYDNQITYFQKNFTSPIGSAAIGVYDFRLVDSLWIEDDFCYEINFQPRVDQAYAFFGKLWLTYPTFALRRIEAEIHPETNINYVKYLRLTLTSEEVWNDAWLPVSEDIEVIAGITVPHEAKDQHFRVYRQAFFRNHRRGEHWADTALSIGNPVKVASNAVFYNEDWWQKQRPAPLTSREEGIFEMVDSVKRTTFYKLFRELGRGYYRTGPVEWGPYINLITFNQVEGLRLSMGLRTSPLFSRKTQLYGYLAYGFKDQKWKYGAGWKHFLSKSAWRFLELRIRDDLEQPGQGLRIYDTYNVPNTLFTFNPVDRLERIQELRLDFESRLANILSGHARVSVARRYPRGILEYRLKSQDGQTLDLPYFDQFNASAALHLSFEERFVNTDFNRRSLGTPHPWFDLTYTWGFNQIAGRQYPFHKLIGGIGQRVKIPFLGMTKFYLEGGKIWGRLPWPSLEIQPGNESFFFDETAFNTMNFMEFVADEFVRFRWDHHWEGILFNRIPLIRKLKLREVTSFKALWGRADPQNMALFEQPFYVFAISEPYYEASVGIENILQVIRLDAVWRLSYLDNPNIRKFGVRLSFSLRL